jgi:hypothetical protein
MVAEFAAINLGMAVVISLDLRFGNDNLGFDLVIDQTGSQDLLFDLIPVLLHGLLLLFQKLPQVLIGEVIGSLDAFNGAVYFSFIHLDTVALDLLVGKLFIHQAVQHLLTYLKEHLPLLFKVESLLADTLGIGRHALLEFRQQNDVFIDHRNDPVQHFGRR